MVDLKPTLASAIDESPSVRTDGFWISYALATAVYLTGAALTRPIFISDSLQYLRTASPDNATFWDFGHLLWRPFLWVLLHHLRQPEPADRFLRAFHILNALSMVAGLVAVWFTIATLRLFTRRLAVIGSTATLLSFAQVVLTHSKGGCAYIFGFTAVSVGFQVLLAAAKSERTAWHNATIPGAFLAMAVCLWLPYIFALPGILLTPVLFSEGPSKPWFFVVRATAVCALSGLVAFGMVAIHLGLLDFRSLVAWAAASSHGVITSGASRVFFGFVRSFLALGENGSHGVAFKRFLLHDPYNPVHLWQIFDLTFWEVVLFYVFMVLILRSSAMSPEGGRALWHLLITGLFVLGFAVVWAGTDLERYLPLFPALMLAIGLGLSRVRIRDATAFSAAVFVATLVVGNIWTLSPSARERRLQELTGTVRSLNEILMPDSLVLLPPVHPLQRIYWDFPEALPLADHNLILQRLVDLDTTDTPLWRTRVCSQMSQRWKKKIPVVIESSLLQRTPARDSLWVEGGDPRVGWRTINNFTSELELGGRVGNTGFFWIPATTRNIETIDHCLSN